MSSVNYPKLPPSQTPEGWSNEANRLSDVKIMFTSQAYGLSDITPVLVEKAIPRFLLESQGRYYLWNAVSDAVVKVEEPVGLEELLGCLDKAKWDMIKAVGVQRMKSCKLVGSL